MPSELVISLMKKLDAALERLAKVEEAMNWIKWGIRIGGAGIVAVFIQGWKR